MAKTAKGTYFDPDELQRQTDEVIKAFKKTGIEINGGVKVGVAECAILIKSSAKLLVNRDTGLLANSIEDRLEESVNSVSGVVGSSVEYAPEQEFLPEPRGKPYLTPALENNKNKFPGIIIKAIKRTGAL